MKDLYENSVFAETLARVKARDISRYWMVDHTVPEIAALMAEGEVTLEVTEQGICVRAVDNGRVRYAVPDTMPGPEELFTHVIGSGGLGFGNEWWQVDEWIGVGEDGTVQPGWELRVTYTAEGDPPIEGVLNAATLAQGIMRIASGAARLIDEFVEQCKLMADGKLDDVNIDAWVGDGIMQVAITGDTPLYG